MFSMRLIFLLMAISLICHDITFGEEPNEDRIGAILFAITKINKNVGVLTVKVDGMEKKVNGIENKVDEVIKKEGELEIHVGDVTKQVGEVKTQVSDVKNEINAVDKKVEKMKSEVLYNTWKFVGRGQEQIYDDQVGKDGTTLKECLELCQKKRISDGVEWNGVTWCVPHRWCYCNKNDRGHSENSRWLHFRAQ